MKCAISGANGYVGSAIVNYLSRQQGYEIHQLRRDARAFGDPKIIPYSLQRGVELERLQGLDVLIHCAYDFQAKTRRSIFESNVRGTLELFKRAERAGVRKIIFISSMAAFDGCRSIYGRAKLTVEQESKGPFCCSIRPGLVHGSSPGGLMGALDKLVARASILPLIDGGNQKLYLTHQDDLGALIQRVCESTSHIEKPISAIHERPMTFKKILETIAWKKGKRLRFFPIPFEFLYRGLKLIEAVGVTIRLRSDSLVGLMNQNPHPDLAPGRELGVSFRPFEG